MAEGCGGNWSLGSWMQSAKEQSSKVYGFVKKDLGEFTHVMQQDTTEAAKSVQQNITQEKANEAGDKVKQGVSSLLSGLSKALTIEAEDLNTPGSVTTKNASSKPYSREQARLHALQLDPGTYLSAPQGASAEDFSKWCETFDLDEHKGDISELLVMNVEVRSLYTRMVPSDTTHQDFWSRYFFRVNKLRTDEARRAQLVKRAEDPGKEDELSWDDDLDEDEWVTERSPAPEQDQPPLPSPYTQTEPTVTAADTDVQTASTGGSDGNHETPVIDRSQEAIDRLQGVQEGVVDNADTRTDVQNTTDSDSSALCDTVMPPGGGTTQPQLEAVPEHTELKVRTKEDMIVVGPASDRTTPSSEQSASHKDSSTTSLDEDWERDFEDDVIAADVKVTHTKVTKIKDGEEDWENWE